MFEFSLKENMEIVSAEKCRARQGFIIRKMLKKHVHNTHSLVPVYICVENFRAVKGIPRS